MIRKLLAASGFVAALALPGAAQTFTHTIDGVTHTHDITVYKTYGTCCLQTSCCTQAYSSCGHYTPSYHYDHHGHGYSYHSGHATTTRTYTHAPVTRTYTRTYTHAPTTVRTYTRSYTSAPTVTRRVYVEQPRTEALSYHPHPCTHHYTERHKPCAH
jgi:hypothetical protein